MKLACRGARKIFDEEAGIEISIAKYKSGSRSLEADLGELGFEEQIPEAEIDLGAVNVAG